MIGISIGAKKEWEAILKYYKIDKNIIKEYIYGEYFLFEINHKKVVFYRCGTRKTKSSGSAQYMIDKFKLKKIIVVGTCAGIDDKYKLLDIFIPNKALQVDCTYIENNEEFKEDYIVDINISKYIINEYNTGVIGSSDKPLIYKNTCDLMKNKNITILDMESAAISYICKVNSIECIIIKGISDFPANYDFNDSNQFNEYAENVPKVINKICKYYLEKFL